MRQIANLADERQVVATESQRLFPAVTVLVESHDGYRVAITGPGVVLPNAGLDKSESNCVNGLIHESPR